MLKTIVPGLLVALFSTVARAEVDAATPGGFAIKLEIQVAASPQKAWKGLIGIGDWWNAEHTYSHDSKNLSLEPRAGGCFCEKLEEGGSVQHMVVVMARPGKSLRMRGGLGPLQEMAVEGAMTIVLTPNPRGTTIALDYRVGGWGKAGLSSLAPAVDGVLAEQLGRLKKLLEGTK